MIGKDYIANVNLYDSAGAVIADAGGTCERVASAYASEAAAQAALEGWLSEQGMVKRVERPARNTRLRDSTPEPAPTPKEE
jgi:hypothetical protein